MTIVAAADLRTLNRTLTLERATLFAAVLTDACTVADLRDNRRLCNFIGQVAEETGGFRSLIESTDYRDAARLDAMFRNVQGLAHAQRLIAAGPVAVGNTIYAGKNGNGDVASGDGFRYRGRGFLQITGRANYRSIGLVTKMPLEAQPDLLGEPGAAARAAAIYWRERAINVAADADDVSTVTLLVNGTARLHLEERQKWHDLARRIWTF